MVTPGAGAEDASGSAGAGPPAPEPVSPQAARPARKPAGPITESASEPFAGAAEPFPLLIAVAASVEQRVRLAELVDDVAPLLLVSSLDDLRRLITPAPAAGDQAGPVEQLGPGDQLGPTPGRPAGMPAGPPVADDLPADDDVLTIDSARSVAKWRDREVALTGLEHDLLTRLNTEPLRVWTYEALHQAVWRNQHVRGAGDVHSLVKRLRRKLADLGTTVTIDAVRGTGFRLTDHQRPSINGARGTR